MSSRTIVLLLGLALLATEASGADTVDGLVRDLGSSSGPVRLRARDVLIARMDPDCVAPILAALPGYDLGARSRAQQVLEALPLERTRKALRSLLRSKEPELRALAAASLYRKGDASRLVVGIRELRDESHPPTVQWPIMVRMYGVKHPDVSAAVRDGLSRYQGNTLRYALIHVWLVEDGLAVPAVRSLGESPDPGVRLPARALLYRLGRDEVLPDLAKDFADPAGTELSLRDAFRILSNGPAPPEVVQSALCDRLDADGRGPVRIRILDQLAAWRCHAVLGRCEKLIDDKDAGVARAALGLVLKLGGRGQRDSLAKRLGHRDRRIRVLVAEALYRLDDLSGLPIVLEESGSRAVLVRREAVRVLGVYRLRRVIPPLLDALEDADAVVRRHAREGIEGVITALYPYRRLDWTHLGYRPVGPAAGRAKAVAILRAWWKARSG